MREVKVALAQIMTILVRIGAILPPLATKASWQVFIRIWSRG